jgi:hypothetical protein
MQLDKTKIRIRYSRSDGAGNSYTDDCYGYIISSDDNGPYKDIASFNIKIQGTGEITQLYTPTSIGGGKMTRYDYSGTGGEVTFTDAALAGKDIQDFVKDGIGLGPIITTGSPVNKEVLYDTTTGTFTWLVPADIFEPIYILYQDV